MKVKAFCSPRLLVATAAQARSVWRGTWALMRARKALALGLAVAAIVLGLVIWPHDQSLLQRLHFWSPAQEKRASALAYFLGTWGDFPTYNIPLALLIWLYGMATKSPAWRRVAVVCFIGAALAGLVDDCFRLTLGRPRPDAHLPDGFYGIGYTFQSRFQSFPSGHAAAVLGAATALLAVRRPLGLLALLFGLSVVWARLELYRHYPSDVAVGSIIGLYCGAMAGWGSRRTWRPKS